jgi:hypothetical protein
MGVVLALALGVLLLVLAVLAGDQPSAWLRAVGVLAQWLGLLLLAGLALYLARDRLISWARQRLIEVAGPALVRSMPPRAVLAAVLPWIYGDRVGHQDVITGVLGGAGRELGGADTAVSKSTTAYFRLRSIDDTACSSEISWTHEISGVRNNHRYVIFATCDPDLFSLVNRERVFPLFEVWKLDNEDQLEEFVPNLRTSLQIGVTYVDTDGIVHVADPNWLEGEEVALRDYDQYVRLPSSVDRKELRIVRFDLYDRADPDHVVDSIQRISVLASHVFPAELAFITWSSPFPCFVRHVTFDVAELPRAGESLLYLVKLSTLTGGSTQSWRGARERIEVPVDSWMLPGHGVTLLWRPIDGAEPGRATQ